jgi:hypothetical protein
LIDSMSTAAGESLQEIGGAANTPEIAALERERSEIE